MEQDERSVAPLTVEEAYELSDAIDERDDAKTVDELGDLLYHVVFLSLLLEERRVGSLSGVAHHAREKLIRRHPHVFGDEQAASADEVLKRWDERKREEPGRGKGVFTDIPRTLPGVSEAAKVQRRAAGRGFDWEDPSGPMSKLVEEVGELGVEIESVGSGDSGRDEQDRSGLDHEVGDVLFAAVAVGRTLGVDPESALRRASGRFRRRVEVAVDVAVQSGEAWSDLTYVERVEYYRSAKAILADGGD